MTVDCLSHPGAPGPRRQNHGRYCGEGLDVIQLLHDCAVAARDGRWVMEWLKAGTDVALAAFHRPSPIPNALRVYLSAGIHGDEPAGPTALRELLRADVWPDGVALWLCPCLNPSGFVHNRRENAAGLDLNRDYRQPRSGEIRAHVGWLDRQPHFDLSICLHEDWEARGFYLYELNPHNLPSHAEAVVQAVSRVCPIDVSEVIDGRPARGGIIRPDLNPAMRPDWPEAFYLIQNRSRHNYTLEAPSDFVLPVRVEALQVAVRTLLAGNGFAGGV